jgi:hypothetical protein
MLLIGLEGKLLGAWVDEARLVISTARVSDRVCLNLQRLMFADHRGIELLRALRTEGIPLMSCSPLIEGLLASGDFAVPVSESPITARDEASPK